MECFIGMFLLYSFILLYTGEFLESEAVEMREPRVDSLPYYFPY